MTPRCRDALARLARRLDLVAALSGRPAQEAYRMVGLEALVYVGNHGLERWRNGAITFHEKLARYLGPVRRVVLELGERLQAVEGVILEDKGASVALHYRNARDPGRARRRILDIAHGLAAEAGLRVCEGKMVVEVQPPADVDKGVALEKLVQEYGLTAALYLGDDRTDVDALRAIRRLRSAGRLQGVGIGVLGADSPPELEREADYVLGGVAGVERFLWWLAQVI